MFSFLFFYLMCNIQSTINGRLSHALRVSFFMHTARKYGVYLATSDYFYSVASGSLDALFQQVYSPFFFSTLPI